MTRQKVFSGGFRRHRPTQGPLSEHGPAPEGGGGKKIFMLNGRKGSRRSKIPVSEEDLVSLSWQIMQFLLSDRRRPTVLYRDQVSGLICVVFQRGGTREEEEEKTEFVEVSNPASALLRFILCVPTLEEQQWKTAAAAAAVMIPSGEEERGERGDSDTGSEELRAAAKAAAATERKGRKAPVAGGGNQVAPFPPSSLPLPRMTSSSPSCISALARWEEKRKRLSYSFKLDGGGGTKAEEESNCATNTILPSPSSTEAASFLLPVSIEKAPVSQTTHVRTERGFTAEKQKRWKTSLNREGEFVRQPPPLT